MQPTAKYVPGPTLKVEENISAVNEATAIARQAMDK
jgi:hypothetical protein